MNNTMILYHDSCTDGFASAWIFRKQFPNAEFIAVQYNNPPPDVSGKDVFIVDFSYPRNVLLDMKNRANSIVVLDHHKTAAKELEGLDFCTFDMNKSGAVLAWEYLFPEEDVPLLIQYVQDRDLWTWKLPFSEEINAVIHSLSFSFEDWDKFVSYFEVEYIRIQGEAILKSQRQQVSNILKNAREVKFLGYDVLAVNSSCMQSEIGNALAKDRPFGVVWFQNTEGKFIYSLRSNENGIDVGAAAKQMSGGGHVRAAGAKSDTLLF